jgi:hypothetical protein
MTFFMGSGDHIAQRRKFLHRLLDEALDALGETQHPPHWDHDPTPEELAAQAQAKTVAQEVMRVTVTTIATDLGQRTLLVDGLQDLRIVKNKYNQLPEAVGLSLDHRNGSWLLTRDDQAGGGPWRRGPAGETPAAAVEGFAQMVAAGKWSPES